MRIEDGCVRWGTDLEDIGTFNVRLRFTERDVSNELAWQVKVEHRKIKLPFKIRGWDAATDGKRVVAWGFDPKFDFKDFNPYRQERPSETHVVIVDIASGEITAERKLEFLIGQAELNATGVYVAPPITQEFTLRNNFMQVGRLSADDLRSLDVQSVPIGGLRSIADRFLSLESDGVEKPRYTLPDMKLVPPILARRVTRFEATPGNRRLADGWLLDGSLWSDDLETCKLLIQPIGVEPVRYRDGSGQPDLAAQRRSGREGGGQGGRADR
jgi:hypothetical protein